MKGTSFVEVRIIPQPEYTKNALFSGRFWGVLKPPIQKPSTNLREKGSFDPISLNPREPLLQHHTRKEEPILEISGISWQGFLSMTLTYLTSINK
jgi:hypothetical protein